MWFARVETDYGECFRVMHKNGTTGGKAILAFLQSLSVYCLNVADEETIQWFSALENKGNQSFCDLLHPLIEGWYSGDWDYKEDEYETFLSRNPSLQIGEDAFLSAIKDVREKWTPVDKMIESVKYLLSIFEEDLPESTYWYEPEDSTPDFQALLATLELAAERLNKKVRINIE